MEFRKCVEHFVKLLALARIKSYSNIFVQKIESYEKSMIGQFEKALFFFSKYVSRITIESTKLIRILFGLNDT